MLPSPFSLLHFAEMATLETWNYQFSHSAYTLGAAHQGNRIAFRLRRRILLYIPTLAHVGQHYDCHSVGGLCHWTGGAFISSIKIVPLPPYILQLFSLFLAIYSLSLSLVLCHETRWNGSAQTHVRTGIQSGR